MKSINHRLLAAALLSLLLFTKQPASAQEAVGDALEARPAIQQVNYLSDQIVAKEIELQKLNARFRLVSTAQPRWRAWRQFLYSEANASCTQAGLIERMKLAYPYMKKPATIYKVSTKTTSSGKKVKTISQSLAKAARAPARSQEEAATVQMTGQLIGAAGDIFELSCNVVDSIQSRKHGYDGKTYGKKVMAVTRELDQLLQEREELLASESQTDSRDLAVARAETAVLHDIRDLSLLQYTEYHSGAGKLRTFQNAAYLLNISKNAAGAAGNMVNLESTHANMPKLAGTASLLTLVAGGIIVVTPVVGRVSGSLAGLVDRRIASSKLVAGQAKEADQFIKDKKILSELLATTDSSHPYDPAERSDIYAREERLFIAQKDNLQRERKLAKSTTVENVVFGTIVGSSRITQGVTGMIGAWHYGNAPWINARLSAAGATAYGAGTAFNILETARVRAAGELSAQKLKKQKLLPRQVVQDRIDTLDSIEKSLHLVANKPVPNNRASGDVTY